MYLTDRYEKCVTVILSKWKDQITTGAEQQRMESIAIIRWVFFCCCLGCCFKDSNDVEAKVVHIRFKYTFKSGLSQTFLPFLFEA